MGGAQGAVMTKPKVVPGRWVTLLFELWVAALPDQGRGPLRSRRARRTKMKASTAATATAKTPPTMKPAIG